VESYSPSRIFHLLKGNLEEIEDIIGQGLRGRNVNGKPHSGIH
jgi:hypothetical protein